MKCPVRRGLLSLAIVAGIVVACVVLNAVVGLIVENELARNIALAVVSALCTFYAAAVLYFWIRWLSCRD
jgi:putative flippase GtrA